jgi:single-stranded DNA-specific DHH superfamily exonuclease
MIQCLSIVGKGSARQLAEGFLVQNKKKGTTPNLFKKNGGHPKNLVSNGK